MQRCLLRLSVQKNWRRSWMTPAAAAAIDAASSQKVMDPRAWVARNASGLAWLEEAAEVVEAGTVPGLLLVAATFISLPLPATSASWLTFWAQSVGPHIGSHALSLRAWINEGLMAIFFFVVELEIKQEFRLGSLASVRRQFCPASPPLAAWSPRWPCTW